MRLPKKVRIVEVGPRDGLQNEPVILSPEIRIALIERLAAAGLTVIEAGSFVSSQRVPQMADTARVLAGLSGTGGLRCPVLVPNRQGLERALAAGAREIAVFAAASETFSARNLNCSIAESLQRYRQVCDLALRTGVRIRGYISCALGCPFEGEIPPQAVSAVAEELQQMGCAEISLGDTIGVGTPGQAVDLVSEVARHIPIERLAGHFHDTYGQALANILAVMELGMAIFDSSVAGLGGCPFAPGAAGNVATEDLLYMLDGLGIETGVDLAAVATAGHFACTALHHPTRSRVARALAASPGESSEQRGD